MFPNSLNNMNRNGAPYQQQYQQYNQNAFSYYNPYQTTQPVVRNVVEPQYYNPVQQMQPMQPVYYPYMQQGVYSPMFFPTHPNIQTPAPAQNATINIFPQRQRKPQQQEPKKQKAKLRHEIDPSKPENSKDEVTKWVESRKKNYPSKANNNRKELEKKLREETGEIVEPCLSILEQKLRKKIRVLSMIDGRTNRKREFEKNYLLRYVTNPYKKVKVSTANGAEEKIVEKTENPNKEDEELKQEEAEEKQIPAEKDVYDVFQEFQKQITELENDKQVEGEIAGQNCDDECPVERKCVSQKSMGLLSVDKAEPEKVQTKETPREKRPIKISGALKTKLGSKALIKHPTEIKKTESIDEIIESLKQKKDKDDSELTNVFTGPPRTSDYKYKTNTLLANLLIDSIYNEKNAIFQCLRYIVRENFFDKKE